MGSEVTKIESILSYYLFQKKIKRHLNNLVNKNKESNNIKEGYLIHPDWIKEWKNMIGYNIIKEYLNPLTIKNKKLDSQQLSYINSNMQKNNIYNDLNTSFLVKNSDFISLKDKIITEESLENFVDKDTFKKLKVNEKTINKEIKYIFKNQMIIFFFKEDRIIKLVIHSLSPHRTIYNLINLKIIIYNEQAYDHLYEIFGQYNSQNIIMFLINRNIFSAPKYFRTKDNKIDYILINEEEYNNIRYNSPSENKNYNGCGIKAPQEINFSLVQRPSFRGLDNVGATCYMNATLQCLANIKPITDYFLNPNKYFKLYENIKLCFMSLKYAQVLIGLFCNENNYGSYCPEDFKNIIGEYNPLFQGVKANDSKDLIIFLLEILNNELVKVHNRNNVINNEKEVFQKINISDENAVLKYFKKDFKRNYCSIIGSHLYGFQKNCFICQYCKGKAINFNIFNLLIFGLEAISNYFNLSQNNSIIPTITFDHCFQFLSKDEIFQDSYCQNCGKTGSSQYKETIYIMPNYLIIILNRGKGNIFNCNVQILESFSPSNYVEKEKNIVFNLIGIVSHFGESGMGGHFIAFCKHSIDKKWRCYNDSIVTECKNDYLQKGTPYILFYKKVLLTPNENNFQSNYNNQFNNFIQQGYKNSQPNLNMKSFNYQNNINKINNGNNLQNLYNNFQQQNMNMFNNNLQHNNMNMYFGQQNMNMNNNNLIKSYMNIFNNNLNQNNMNMFNNNLQPNNMNMFNINFQNQNFNLNNNNNIQRSNFNNNSFGQINPNTSNF